MKTFNNFINEKYEEYPADDMTITELKVAIDAATNILDMLEKGSKLQRWQISAIVKSSEELSSVYSIMNADMKEEADFKVSVEGLPQMFVKGENPADVKNNLRKVLKNPDLIKDVKRVTKPEVLKTFRDFISGKEDETEGDEE